MGLVSVWPIYAVAVSRLAMACGAKGRVCAAGIPRVNALRTFAAFLWAVHCHTANAITTAWWARLWSGTAALYLWGAAVAPLAWQAAVVAAGGCGCAAMAWGNATERIHQ